MTAGGPLRPVHELRPYQAAAVEAVLAAHAEPTPARPCLVAPTGSGKTVMGAAIVAAAVACGERVLWLAHRRELLDKAADALRRALGDPMAVGVVSPIHPRDDGAPIQVASVQTLAARDRRPEAALAVLDEAHHYVADTWRDVADSYAAARIVGLTATPQRSDGRAMGVARGGLFDRLIVAAQYSDLLAAGHLVPCRVIRPDRELGARELSADPIEAYRTHAVDAAHPRGRLTFVFAHSVERAHELAAEYSAAGFPARCVESDTRPGDRAEAIEAFRAGDVRILTNVFALTEGVDVPAASCVVLARGIGHVGPYMQMVGRVLRPALGADGLPLRDDRGALAKRDAMLIDLPGRSYSHGLPTNDRSYSLDGRAISVVGEPLKVCAECGATNAASAMQCELCGYQFAAKTPIKTHYHIYDMALREVFAGADTPDAHKRREWDRLASLATRRGFGYAWAAREWKKLFGDTPAAYLAELGSDERRAELRRMQAFGAQRGFKPGFAAVRYRELFGTWPPRESGGRWAS